MQLTFILLLGSLEAALLLPTNGVMLVPDLAGVLARATVTADEMVMVAMLPFGFLRSPCNYNKFAGVLEALGTRILILYIIKALNKCLVDFDPMVKTWG